MSIYPGIACADPGLHSIAQKSRWKGATKIFRSGRARKKHFYFITVFDISDFGYLLTKVTAVNICLAGMKRNVAPNCDIFRSETNRFWSLSSFESQRQKEKESRRRK